MFRIWSMLLSTTLLPGRHLCLPLKHGRIPGFDNSSLHPPHHPAHERWSAPGVTTERGWRANPAAQQSCHSRGCVLPQGELPPAVSAPWNGWWQQPEMCGRKDSRLNTHSVLDTVVGTHPHGRIYLCEVYTHVALPHLKPFNRRDAEHLLCFQLPS